MKNVNLTCDQPKGYVFTHLQSSARPWNLWDTSTLGWFVPRLPGGTSQILQQKCPQSTFHPFAFGNGDPFPDDDPTSLIAIFCSNTPVKIPQQENASLSSHSQQPKHGRWPSSPPFSGAPSTMHLSTNIGLLHYFYSNDPIFQLQICKLVSRATILSASIISPQKYKDCVESNKLFQFILRQSPGMVAAHVLQPLREAAIQFFSKCYTKHSPFGFSPACVQHC